MGEKVYKPILKDGDHLVGSKDNPNRVRGLARDENNQNPDIPEWEEVDLDDLQSETAIIPQYEENQIELTPEQREMAEKIGAVTAEIVIDVGSAIYRDIIKPWWQHNAWPWIRAKGKEFSQKRSKKRQEVKGYPESNTTEVFDPKFEEVSTQIDQVFEQMYFDLDEAEATEHLLRLIYHMLGLANEIRILSNSRIRKTCDSDPDYLENVKEAEHFLSAKVAGNLDRLLSDPKIRLDLDTSRELFALTGGGVRINGEYAPVQVERIEEALREISVPNEQ